MVTDAKHQQRMGALEEANWVRFSRAQLKHNLRSGDVELVDLIEKPPEYIKKMRIFKLLMATPGIGIAKAKRILGPYISIDKTVGDLTPHQQKVIIHRLKTLTWRNI
jgi:hypothetical protein